MKLTKEFEEKLKRFINLVEEPLEKCRNVRGFENGKFFTKVDIHIVELLQIRKEIFDVLEPPVITKEKYIQLSIEDQIKTINANK